MKPKEMRGKKWSCVMSGIYFNVLEKENWFTEGSVASPHRFERGLHSAEVNLA